VVSADVINESEIPWVLGIHLLDRDPESVLVQRIGDHGWAVVTTVERVVRSRLGEQLGTATAEEMEQVNIALKACLDLD
jgi:mRNA-degrading endonuclease toxin of MazEF toxin-antitoxin module